MPGLPCVDALLEAVWVIEEREPYCAVCQSRRYALLSGHTLEDMRGQPMWALVATPQTSCCGAHRRRCAVVRTISATCCAPMVPWYRWEQRVQRVPWCMGAVWMATMLDRSEQQQHEAELEKLLAELRATLDSVADGNAGVRLRWPGARLQSAFGAVVAVARELLVQRNDEAIALHMLARSRSPCATTSAGRLCWPTPCRKAQTFSACVRHRCWSAAVCPSSFVAAGGRVFAFQDITHQAEIQASLRLAARVFAPA